ncbi:hypothetical protein AMATHDRAFT_153021 [Amanita thiersii Skay4041]|uniref:Carboxylic ester hydrolase n=1 Tax=Amanita thiersii Skay4041 TaxID=703135 RepID=A0A2A9NFP3_9AGAR|nr:hypothetical protein AMATHDRAFT_153021 [Amanita thiersii Skay4041]
MHLKSSTLLVIQAAALGFAAPTVTLDSATFTGVSNGFVSKFLGIPFAQPPVGQLRFQLPQPLISYTGSHQATGFGPACPQQAITLPLPEGLAQDVVDLLVNTVFDLLTPSSEDCLTLNVIKPVSATTSSKLPVVVWIFGGGFETGSTATYDGGAIVSRSIALGEPVIYVSMNYRLSGFGFLAGKEVRAAGIGNLGLQDQRLALRWVQKYISAFGGDPTKVTIWGESAGAISVSLQMLANGGNTEGLFRAGFMQSGSPIPVGPVENGQQYYDDIVKRVGCSGAADTLQCLRTVPYSSLKAAIDASPSIFAYQSLKLAWLPRVDGVFLTDNPQQLLLQGKVANVPFVTGDCDDEGTLFSLSTLNVTTDQEVEQYLKTVFFPGVSDADISALSAAYPSDITQGSPYDTGILNALTPQFKRIAAVNGDGVFQAPRRFFLNQLSGKQNTWVFLSKRLKLTPALGSFHASDLLNSYGGGELGDYLIFFANTLNPNRPFRFSWPKYSTASRSILTFLDGLIPLLIEKDTYRQEGMNILTNITLVHPI